MTKKDFVVIADTIKEYRNLCLCGDCMKGCSKDNYECETNLSYNCLVNMFSNTLSEKNINFNSSKFSDYCHEVKK
jgi:hypothetical protein